MLVLKQSTSIDIRMGPFVDATDGVTPETGITLGTADQAEALKADGAATVTMGGAFSAISGADGWYDYTCAAGDVDTVGEVVFVVQDSSVCLPVFVRAQVMEEATYDALYGASAAGFDASGNVTLAAATHTGAIIPTVTTTTTTTNLTNLPAITANWLTATGIEADAITAVKIATDAIGADALAADAVNEIWAKICETEGSRTAQQIMSVVLSACAGVTSAGGATFKTPEVAGATRITATVNASNERTAITLAPSS